jgi:hypothetical protein
LGKIRWSKERNFSKSNEEIRKACSSVTEVIYREAALRTWWEVLDSNQRPPACHADVCLRFPSSSDVIVCFQMSNAYLTTASKSLYICSSLQKCVFCSPFSDFSAAKVHGRSSFRRFWDNFLWNRIQGRAARRPACSVAPQDLLRKALLSAMHKIMNLTK